MFFFYYFLTVFLPFILTDDECGVTVTKCVNSKYRTITGECTNLKNPNWGTPHSTYDRLSQPRYGPDGSIRKAVNGSDLPNARLVSRMVYQDDTLPEKHLTMSAIETGQFVAHDLSFSYVVGDTEGCCSESQQWLEKEPQECRSVKIPEGDPVYDLYNVTCISNSRTYTNRDFNCSTNLKYDEQLSETNAFLDLSINYGVSEEDHKTLRAYKDGKLKLDERNGQEWFLQSKTRTECPFSRSTDRCYRAADSRVDQNPLLTIVHLMWAREHNRLASKLKSLNPNWNDEKLFQTARQIAIAEHQYISYYELLPLFLGRENMLKSKIIYEKQGFINDYDENMRPHVFNEQAQGAMRRYHTMIQGEVDLVNEGGCPYRYANLRDVVNKPNWLEERDNLDGIVRGMNTQPAIAPDTFAKREITAYLFINNKPVGLDLITRDLQRSRIHGLASYNDIREKCGFKKAETFDDFLDHIEPKKVELLKKLYDHPDSVDLVVGGTIEKAEEGTMSGPTYNCIMMKQYYRTRKSDRLWFENSESGLTERQLREIKKASMSKLFCDNVVGVKTMQRHGFLQVSKSNPRVDCKRIPGPNLELWRETPRIRGNCSE
ncbi:unnamed protein product [Phyllotreta striolata]|uniref:Uncharacterized protein n=1 Tax=Phyllotreta striolata TaxID=444603 RepID=A0A9N9TTN6_PHYSR|nr:unnamed protein product [Phyllotreta striolata]